MNNSKIQAPKLIFAEYIFCLIKNSNIFRGFILNNDVYENPKKCSSKILPRNLREATLSALHSLISKFEIFNGELNYWRFLSKNLYFVFASFKVNLVVLYYVLIWSNLQCDWKNNSVLVLFSKNRFVLSTNITRTK